MKALFSGLAASLLIAVIAYFALDALDYTEAARGSDANVRLGDAGTEDREPEFGD